MFRRLELVTRSLLAYRLPGRNTYAILGVALLLAAGAFRGAMAALPPPLIEIVVCDGTACTTVAGCSEPDCLGLRPTATGVVTNARNYVGWGVSGGNPKKPVYLYVDGRQVSSARTGKLLMWSPSTVGPH